MCVFFLFIYFSMSEFSLLETILYEPSKGISGLFSLTFFLTNRI